MGNRLYRYLLIGGTFGSHRFASTLPPSNDARPQLSAMQRVLCALLAVIYTTCEQSF
jgi:hypothetical protein